MDSLEERNYPLYLYATNRLLARLNDQNPKYGEIKRELTTTRLGYQGELRSDQQISRSRLPQGNRILHDLTVRVYDEDPVQIDTLVLTPHFAYILEVKNISGKLELVQQPALLKRTTRDGKSNYFQSPFVQLNTAVNTLNFWLLAQDIDIPVIGAVFLASKYAEPHFEKKMPVHFIREIPDVLHSEITNRPKLINEATVDWIATALRNEEIPYEQFPLCNHFDLAPVDLFTDSLCRKCLGRLETSTKRIGTCLKCNNRQWIPYTETMVDYFLIFNKTATLASCSKFLNLGRSKTAKIMKSPLFKRRGNTNRTSFELNRPNMKISPDGKLMIPGERK